MPDSLAPRLSNGWKLFWFFFLFAFLAGTLLSSLWSRPNASVQISFNHLKHRDAGVTCKDCHLESRQVSNTTLPDLAFCLMCHESAITESPEEEKIRQAAAEGKQVVWQRLTRLPAHVYFSHRRHVTLGQLDCAACHGELGSSTAVKPHLIRRPTMDNCMACHEQQKIRNDCNDCHR
jgi:hypothetical protein